MDRQPFDDIRAVVGELKPADAVSQAAALARLGRDAPAADLGVLADIVGWIAGWRGAARVLRPVIALYAGAHTGAGDAGATRAAMEAIAAGAAPVSRAADHLGAGLDVFDLAIDRPVAEAGISERECAATMAFGMEALAKQPDLLILGAFGAGVEAAASALLAALEREADDPLDALRRFGGRQTAAVCGAVLAAGVQRTPVLLDGGTGLAAAAVLFALTPSAIAHCRLGGVGADLVARRTSDRIGLAPLIDLGIAAHDGTGSTAVLSLIKLACALPLET